MKKTAKIVLISLSSLVALLLVVLIVVVNFVLTPEKVTPFVRKQAANFLSCETQIDTVDVTFFKTFPNVSLHIRGLLLSEDNPESTDTLVFIDDCYFSVDIKRFLKNREIIIQKVNFYDGFIDVNGISRISLINKNDTTKVDQSESSSLTDIDLKALKINNVNVIYKNDSTNLSARVGNLDFSAIGQLHDNNIFADVNLLLNDTYLSVGSSVYLNGVFLYLSSPITIHLNNNNITSVFVKPSKILINDLGIALGGTVEINEDQLFELDIDYQIDGWDIDKVEAIVPTRFENIFEGMDIQGALSLNGKVSGAYGKTQKPVISTSIDVQHVNFIYDRMPFAMKDVNAGIITSVDLGNLSNIDLDISRMTAITDFGDISLDGVIKDLTDSLVFDISAEMILDLRKCINFLPEQINLYSSGRAFVDLKDLRLSVNDIKRGDYENIIADGNIHLTDFIFDYNDDIHLDSRDMLVLINLPGNSNSSFESFLTAAVKGEQLNLTKKSNTINADISDADLKANLSNFMDKTKSLCISIDYVMDDLHGSMDTVSLNAANPKGSFAMLPSKKGNRQEMDLSLMCNDFFVGLGDDYLLSSARINIDGKIDYDSLQNNLILKWNPEVSLDMDRAVLSIVNEQYPVNILSLKATFTPDTFNIQRGDIALGNSTFELNGELTNLDSYLLSDSLLKGEFNFISSFADINQLMDFVSGFGKNDSVDIVVNQVDTSNEIFVGDSQTSLNDTIDNPFMVPLGVDFVLKTNVEKAKYNTTNIENLGGQLYIKDGIMVLEQMAFTCDAARMQLTALYKSPRMNHLFVGLDFHLLDIRVADLIDMIPDIDTIVPMLKSFSGRGEFHLAAETYLKSNYDLKMSTLKGAAAFSGNDLVVLDSDTFDKISSMLMFSKKAENVIDSLSVEMTVFRNEIDVYPFMLVMDKYKAIISGRHNLDMSFDYNISLIDPLPVRIGLDISGNIKDLHYKLAPCKYSNIFRPEKRNAVMERTMELKNLISTSLRSNVK